MALKGAWSTGEGPYPVQASQIANLSRQKRQSKGEQENQQRHDATTVICVRSPCVVLCRLDLVHVWFQEDVCLCTCVQVCRPTAGVGQQARSPSGGRAAVATCVTRE